MTEMQLNKLKQEQMRCAHTGIRIKDIYPSVEQITINHRREHRSFLGLSKQEGAWVLTPQDEACFILSCLNHECSSIGFDLKDVISSAIRQLHTSISGEMDCEGQEAPDHPEQSCGGALKYDVSITYKHEK